MAKAKQIFGGTTDKKQIKHVKPTIIGPKGL